MELADALKILAVAWHFDDLDLALRYVGCARSEVPLADVSLVPPPAQDDGDRVGTGVLDDGAPRPGPVDGWSLLTDTELEDAIREAEGDPPQQRGGRAGARRGRRSPRGTEPRQHRYMIPVLLEPDDEQPEPAPVYNSVPWRNRAGHARASAAYSAINPRTGAATMHALLKRQARSAEVDVEALIRRLSLALPITATPRLQRTMSVPPMHLLYDTGLLIGPYADDVQQLVRLSRALFDAEILDIRAFRKSLRGGCGQGPVWTWRPFRFPSRPATVAFISGSFGGHLDVRARELAEIVSELERRGHRACVLWLGDPPGLGGSMLRSWRMIRA